MSAVPCKCGSRDAYWHGDTARIYSCDTCWSKRPENDCGTFAAAIKQQAMRANAAPANATDADVEQAFRQ